MVLKRKRKQSGNSSTDESIKSYMDEQTKKRITEKKLLKKEKEIVVETKRKTVALTKFGTGELM